MGSQYIQICEVVNNIFDNVQALKFKGLQFSLFYAKSISFYHTQRTYWLAFFLSQDYIARFGHGSAKLARQAQSKEKVLAKMVSGGLTEKVTSDKVHSCQPTSILFCLKT